MLFLWKATAQKLKFADTLISATQPQNQHHKVNLYWLQLEKITVKKAQAKVVKCAKNKCWVPRNPLGHLVYIKIL